MSVLILAAERLSVDVDRAKIKHGFVRRCQRAAMKLIYIKDTSVVTSRLSTLCIKLVVEINEITIH